MKKQDMVITTDIPLAAEAIEKGGLALNPRGELYTLENIKSRLNMRDFMETMRSSGLQIQSNQATITNSEIKNFANHFSGVSYSVASFPQFINEIHNQVYYMIERLNYEKKVS